MNKSEKVILIIAGIFLVFSILSTLLFLPQEGTILELILLIPIIPIIIGVIILVRHRSDPIIPPVLRVVGFVIFILWILSFFIGNPFRG